MLVISTRVDVLALRRVSPMLALTCLRHAHERLTPAVLAGVPLCE
jgi:hypothetical protein